MDAIKNHERKTVQKKFLDNEQKHKTIAKSFTYIRKNV